MQTSQENTCHEVHFLVKMHAYACNFFKEELHGKCLHMNIANFCRTFFYRAPQGDFIWITAETLTSFRMLWNGHCSCVFTAEFEQEFGGVFNTCQTPTMEIFWETNQRLKLVNFFRRKSSSQMSDKVQSTNLAFACWAIPN